MNEQTDLANEVQAQNNGRIPTEEVAPAVAEIPPRTSFAQLLSSLGRPFWLFWTGESIIMLGGAIVQFALRVWIFQKTGSALSFSGAIVVGIVPALLVSPFAAHVIDRYNRRTIIIISDCLMVILSLVMAFLLWRNQLEIMYLYIIIIVSSIIGSFQAPAVQASMSLMVAENQLTRSSGVMGVSSTLLGIVAPTLAGLLMADIGFFKVILLDLSSFLIGAIFVWRALANIKPNVTTLVNSSRSLLGSTYHNFLESLNYFRRDSQILGMLFYAIAQVCMLSIVSTMILPLILSNHSPDELGIVLTFGAIGALVGNMLMVFLNSPGRRMVVVMACDSILAICIGLAGITTNMYAYCFLQFVAGIVGGVSTACLYALWMSKIPESQRGSILVALSTIGMICTATIAVTSGLLVDKIIDPALLSNGILSSSIGHWLGAGKGQGMELMFVISGILGTIITSLGFAYKPLRELP